MAIYPGFVGVLRLRRVANLLPHRIPTQCWYSDILKKIMVNCMSLSFILLYAHDKAHRCYDEDYNKLLRLAQLNVHCDGIAKGVIWGLSGIEMPKKHCFPLEALSV